MWVGALTMNFLCSVLTEFRTRLPKICCFGVLIILSWRHSRNSSCRKGSQACPFLPNTGHNTSHKKSDLPVYHLKLGVHAEMGLYKLTKRNSSLLLVLHPPIYLLLTSPQFTVPISSSFVLSFLHRFIISLSKMYQSFLLR